MSKHILFICWFFLSQASSRTSQTLKRLMRALKQMSIKDEEAARLLITSATGKFIRTALGNGDDDVQRAVLNVSKGIAEMMLEAENTEEDEAEMLCRWFGVKDKSR